MGRGGGGEPGTTRAPRRSGRLRSRAERAGAGAPGAGASAAGAPGAGQVPPPRPSGGGETGATGSSGSSSAWSDSEPEWSPGALQRDAGDSGRGSESPSSSTGAGTTTQEAEGRQGRALPRPVRGRKREGREAPCEGLPAGLTPPEKKRVRAVKGAVTNGRRGVQEDGAVQLGENDVHALYAALDPAGRGFVFPSDVRALAQRFGLELPGELLGDMFVFSGAASGRLSAELFRKLLDRLGKAGKLHI